MLSNNISEPITLDEVTDKKIVHNGCMITFSGIVVDLFNPQWDKINILDIAHGLSNTCRWNGATKSYYSVAEHCCRMFDLAETDDQKMTALFHDAEEAYWGDVITPLKNLLPVEIRKKMEDMRNVIFDKYEIKPIDEYVEKLDKEALAWELENLIKNHYHYGWSPSVAKAQWIFRGTSLGASKTTLI